MARYLWASQLASGRAVLDAGCGVGYGTALLAGAGPPRWSASTSRPRPSRPLGPARPTTPPSSSATSTRCPSRPAASTLVVCFEVIEHVERQDAVSPSSRGCSRPDGVLAVSSPNRGVYPAGNPHHLHEYVPEELRAALEAHFDARRAAPPARVAGLGRARRRAGRRRLAARRATTSRWPKRVGRGPAPSPTPSRSPAASRSRRRRRRGPGGVADSALSPSSSVRGKPRSRAARVRARTSRRYSASRRELRQDAATLLGELDDKRAELRNVYASLSWRLTEPLRRAKRLRRR